jgi:hypothetical protein
MSGLRVDARACAARPARSRRGKKRVENQDSFAARGFSPSVASGNEKNARPRLRRVSGRQLRKIFADVLRVAWRLEKR